jgi:hypothetical protein
VVVQKIKSACTGSALVTWVYRYLSYLLPSKRYLADIVARLSSYYKQLSSPSTENPLRRHTLQQTLSAPVRTCTAHALDYSPLATPYFGPDCARARLSHVQPQQC